MMNSRYYRIQYFDIMFKKSRKVMPMAITIFDEEFLKKNQSLIDRLLDDESHRKKLLEQLSKNKR